MTRYDYDEAGNEIHQIDALNWINVYAYDGMGRRISHTMPGGQTESFGYDLAGNLLLQTNCNGVVLTNQYDPLNRLLSRTGPGGYQIGFTYTLTGQRATMTDASGISTYSYDVRDRLLQKIVNFGSALTNSLNYAYDASGNLTNLWSGIAGGVTNVYQYDALNRLTNVQGDGGGIASYGFDAVGNLQSGAFGNGVTNLYQYDKLNRLTNAVWNLGSSARASFYYQLGLTGNRTNLIETVDTTSRTNAWQYDGLYRLTNEDIIGTGNVEYGLDAVGNRTNRNSSVTGLADQTPAYNTNDWLTTDAYDSNGNTLWTTNAGTPIGPYEYDAENHLTNFNSVVTITYNGDGLRASKNVGGVITYYLVDDRNPTGYAQVVEEWTSTGGSAALSKVYNYGLSLISQRVPGASTNYFIFDGHGSTRILTDGGGGVVNVFVYDAYGNLIASNTTAQTLYLYAGEQWDSDINQYYLRARTYNPGTGRFWTADTYEGDQEDPLSLHKYLYAEVNPVNNTDPTGFYTQQFGYLAHAAIEQIYANDHLGDTILPFGSPTGLGGPLNPLSRLKPDIFNISKRRWAEIKPLSQSGIAKAAIQYAAYNLFDLFGYYPDAGWQPSTHEALAGSDPIVFFNAGGIIFYTDAVSNLEDLLRLATIQAVRQYFLANQAIIARGLIESLARARTLATFVVPAAEADVGVGVGTATATAAIGGGAIP